MQEIVGGFVITPECADQLVHVFSRVVFSLRLHFLHRASSGRGSETEGSQDCSVQLWLNGVKIVRRSLSAVITFSAASGGGDDGKKDQVIVMCRGPVDQRQQLFFFQVLYILLRRLYNL